MHKKLLIILILCLPLYLNAKTIFNSFIDKQIELVKQLNDENITQEKVLLISKMQDKLYNNELENILSNKNSFLNKFHKYDVKIYALQRIINVNKKRANKYAVTRDEILIDSYKLLGEQSKMISNILKGLDRYKFNKFIVYINSLVSKNNEYARKINLNKYKYILSVKGNATVIKEAKNNFLNLQVLLEINKNILNYTILFERKIYRLNKYTKYNLIKIVLYMNNTAISQSMEPIFNFFNLSTVKVLLISLIIAFVYIIKKVFVGMLISLLLKVEYIKLYAIEIVTKLKRPIELIAILININLIVYIYNDFGTSSNISGAFNIMYVFMIIWSILIIGNKIALMQINNINSKSENIKNEVINIGIKVLNGTIIIIGILLMLHFAGVNLTAILSGLGIGGLAVALAAKDSLSNFFGTLSILLGNTFSQGDWISSDTSEGVVVEIGLRVTRVRTFDNAIIAIPNAKLANQDVINWNRRTLGRRIKMSIGIKYNSKKEDIKKAIEELRDMLKNHPGIATENTQHDYVKHGSLKLVSKDDEYGVKKIFLVYLDKFENSSINILVYCFSKSVKWEEWLKTKEDVMYKIMDILEQNNLEFAFPSLSIYDENKPKK